MQAIENEDADQLRRILDAIWALKVVDDRSDVMSNIVKG